MLWRLRETLMRFMAGRYGTDKLNHFLMVTYLVLWVIQMFFRGTAAYILSLVGTAIAVVLIFRTLSRNINRRQAENERFLRMWAPISRWFGQMFVRLRDIRRFRYRTCPACSARLRLPILRGRRTVTCSRCNTQFKAFFL
jgi:hypothetical protein